MFSPFMASHTASLDTFNAPASSLARQTSISRGRSFKQRLKRLWKRLLRPFALAGRRPLTPSVYPPSYAMSSLHRSQPPMPSRPNDESLTTQMAEASERLHTSIYKHPNPTYQPIAVRAENHVEPIALPFRLSVDQIHDKTHRNVPYLRQSWTRIDFVAIMSFWIAFALAMTGVERGVHHIGIFRAMSVIRTARLLTITSGTTVSAIPSCRVFCDLLSTQTIMHSLKIARPLIARVAYFVLFAMVIFS